jgi:hypothetical protein
VTTPCHALSRDASIICVPFAPIRAGRIGKLLGQLPIRGHVMRPLSGTPSYHCAEHLHPPRQSPSITSSYEHSSTESLPSQPLASRIYRQVVMRLAATGRTVLLRHPNW